MPVSRFRLISLATALGLASSLAFAQTTINLNTANGACIAVTDSAGLTLDPTPGSTALRANGVSLTAVPEGACEVAGGGPAADFGAELYISATEATDTPYTPIVGAPFYVIWNATSDAQRCTRGGLAASGWTPGTTACTDAACTGRHAEAVVVNTAGVYNFSVTCTNATGYALLPASMNFPPPAVTAPTPNPIPLTVPATAIAGVDFAVTWPQMQNATRCDGTGTLAGVNVPNLGDWTTLTTVTTSRSVTVPAGSAAGALQLTLKCWNADNSASATGVSSNIAVTPATSGSCPATITTPYGQRTRVSTSGVSYGVYPTMRPNVDLSQWNNIWGHNTVADGITAWPGVNGAAPVIRQFARNGYIGAKFRTPASMPSSLNGTYLNPSTVGGPNVIMAISRTCGDFSQNLPAPTCLVDHRYGDPAGSGVPTSDSTMASWRVGATSSWCTLEPNTDYYVNMIFADPASTVECVSGATTCLLSAVHNWGN